MSQILAPSLFETLGLKLVFYSCLLLAFQSCNTQESLELKASAQITDFLNLHSAKWPLHVILREKNAKFTIVHIRQQHYSDILTKRLEKKLKANIGSDKILQLKTDYLKQIKKINNVQKEIFQFLCEVAGSQDFLYVEGRAFPHTYREEFLKDYINDTILAVSRVVNSGSQFALSIPNPPLFLGASITLAQKEQMIVIGAENLMILNLTLSLYESSQFSTADLANFLKHCHEAREDQMVKNMAKNFEDLPFNMSSIRFLVCGSKHDLSDNVKKWNDKNPEFKFNLVTYTPSALK